MDTKSLPTAPAITLPADQYAHPGAPTEWWWHIGTLRTADGREFGFEVNACGAIGLGVFTEIAIADIKNQVHYQIVNDHLGFAGKWAETDTTKPWYVDIPGTDDDANNGLVSMKSIDGNPLNMAVEASFIDAATQAHCKIELDLFQQGPPLLVWGTGCEKLSSGGSPITDNNYYYSLTNLKASGSITIGGEEFAVTGLTWMDHEYGGFPNPGPGKQNIWTLQDMQFGNGLHLSNYTRFGLLPQEEVPMPSSATLLLPGGESVFVQTTTTPKGPMQINGTTYFGTYEVVLQLSPACEMKFLIQNICPNQTFNDPMHINSGYEGVARCEMAVTFRMGEKAHPLTVSAGTGTAWIEQSL